MAESNTGSAVISVPIKCRYVEEIYGGHGNVLERPCRNDATQYVNGVPFCDEHPTFPDAEAEASLAALRGIQSAAAPSVILVPRDEEAQS